MGHYFSWSMAVLPSQPVARSRCLCCRLQSGSACQSRRALLPPLFCGAPLCGHGRQGSDEVLGAANPGSSALMKATGCMENQEHMSIYTALH